jgi:hypothetical protein
MPVRRRRRVRGPGSDGGRRFAGSLGQVARELDRLPGPGCRDRHVGFGIQRAFIESRYQDDAWLTESVEPKYGRDRPRSAEEG